MSQVNELKKVIVKGDMSAPLAVEMIHIPQLYMYMKLKVTIEQSAWLMVLVSSPDHIIRAQALVINGEKEIILSDDPQTSTYSTISGCISSGDWSIQLMNGSAKEISYTIEVECGNEVLPRLFQQPLQSFASSKQQGDFMLDEWDASSVKNEEQRWYRGDFHTHTYISDGKLSPAEGFASAKEMGLDFFVATDHNILPTKWIEGDMLIIPGIEVTSSKGHFNALGLTSWIDWRPMAADGGMESEEGMNRILTECKQKGALRSINHPMLKPWDWTFKKTALAEIDVIEIWNDPTFPDNVKATEEALLLWDVLLNDGYRMTGIGGSDAHNRPDESYVEGGEPSLIGDPSTFVWAKELSAKEILQSVYSGNVYVTRGPIVDVTLTSGEDLVQLGAEVNMEVDVKLNYKSCQQGSTLVEVRNGKRTTVATLNKKGRYTGTINWSESYEWVRYEFRGSNGELLAFLNPIFFGKKETSLRTWNDLREKVRLEDGQY